MARTNDQMPEVVFLGPGKKKVPFKYVVFQVMEKADDGKPTLVRMMRDHESVEVDDGMEFMTGYVPRHMAEVE